eukprot:TRINITY_DN24185_c0_g1_i1.p1 TRINITY_DN24185_c0_g1~~TRINITY_DN24185_c0_g1_i1.p1  ORF type:complete len:121 (-),score=11.35 TRINITY_DN24185_c0_g1_i1:42-404(-)
MQSRRARRTRRRRRNSPQRQTATQDLEATKHELVEPLDLCCPKKSLYDIYDAVVAAKKGYHGDGALWHQDAPAHRSVDLALLISSIDGRVAVIRSWAFLRRPCNDFAREACLAGFPRTLR